MLFSVGWLVSVEEIVVEEELEDVCEAGFVVCVISRPIFLLW